MADTGDRTTAARTRAAWIRALRSSHDRFTALVSPLDDDAIQGPSYDDGWSIAQVASHLGSQAEIFGLFLDAGLSGTAAPGADRFHPIWDEWNNRTPARQVADSVRASEELVARFEGLSEAEQEAFTLSVFGTEQDLVGLAGMRLGEHAVHTWDVAVALDPAAVVAPDAVDLLVDTLPTMAGRAGKAAEDARAVVVETIEPKRTFTLTTGPEVALGSAADGTPSDLRLTAEAFVRLVYGRLDAAHTPADVADNPVLDPLRQVFPGF
jgi:uncharacterized protein (TIGR03083 family)